MDEHNDNRTIEQDNGTRSFFPKEWSFLNVRSFYFCKGVLSKCFADSLLFE